MKTDTVQDLLRDSFRERAKSLKTRTISLDGCGSFDAGTRTYRDLDVPYVLIPSDDLPRYTIVVDGLVVGWAVRGEKGWDGYTSNRFMERGTPGEGTLVGRTATREDALWEVAFQARGRLRTLLGREEVRV